MFEAKLEFAVHELINNTDPKKKQILLENVGELLLNIPYFKMFMECYPELGPLMYWHLINHLNFKKFKEKTTIWDYNDPIDGVYIIISGEVKICKPPDSWSLIRCKNVEKKTITFKNPNNIKIFEQFSNNNEKYEPKFKFSQYTLNLMKKRSKIFGPNLYKQPKQILIDRPKIQKDKKSFSAKYINNLNLDIKEHKNISNHEEITSITEQNFLYREPQEYRRVDYIEKFGKMIGEDALLQEVSNRKYACEAYSKCILAFLSARKYHVFFDKINKTIKGNIISFLYKMNYFNNRNDFIHKLCKTIRKKTYKKGTFLYKRNMPFLNMYILKKGTVEINFLKTSKYKSDMNSDLIINSNRILKKNISLNDIQEIKKEENLNRFTKERTFELYGEYEEKRIYTLINYGKGEILGNIEYYYKLKKYLFTAKCITDVDFLEIDINTFRNIYKPYNNELFEQKTKNQIKYFSKRIKEINLIHQKNDEDQFRTRNKFMKVFYQRNPLSSLRINEKYINNVKSNFPINLKYKNKKLTNTRISPFCLYELASALSNNKKQNSKNVFRTNNIDLTTNLIGNNIINKKESMNFSSQANYKNGLNLINLTKYKIKQPKNIKNQIQSINNSKKKGKIENKIHSNKKIKSNSFCLESEIYNMKKKNINIEHKTIAQIYLENCLKKKMKFSNSAFNFKYIQNKEKSSEFINAFLNIYKQVQKDKREKKKAKLREKINIVEEKKEIDSTIAFNGYQVYLHKNKRTKINLKKHF